MEINFENEKTKLNFNGLEMRGINDLPMYDMKPNNDCLMKRCEITTNRGDKVTVMIQKGKLVDKRNLTLMTMHDIGTNYSMFSSFFNYPEMKVILEYFTVYHVCAPGHAFSDEVYDNTETRSGRLLSHSTSMSGPSGGVGGDTKYRSLSTALPVDYKSEASANTNGLYPSIEELATMVGEVSDQLGCGNPIGFGMGAGSNILVRCAMQRPSLFTGLWLINPNDSVSSYWSWIKLRWRDIPQVKSSGLWTEPLLDMLVNHWFGYGVERSMDIEESLVQSIQHNLFGNSSAIAGYIDSYLDRTGLGLVRDMSVNSWNCGGFKVDTMLVTGELARDHVREMTEMNGNMDPRSTQYIAMPDCTGMLMDEIPDRLSIIFLNFLRNLGILASMTPDKLQLQARDYQIQQQQELHAIQQHHKEEAQDTKAPNSAAQLNYRYHNGSTVEC